MSFLYGINYATSFPWDVSRALLILTSIGHDWLWAGMLSGSLWTCCVNSSYTEVSWNEYRVTSCSSEGEQLCSACRTVQDGCRLWGRSMALGQLMTLQIWAHLCTAQSFENQAALPPGFTIIIFCTDGLFWRCQTFSFVVKAFRGRDVLLLFHPDIPLGPSCGQSYKKQIMLLVSVLSNLHKTINTSHRDFLRLWFCGVVLWISSPLSRMCWPFLSLDLFCVLVLLFHALFLPHPSPFEISFEAVTTHRLYISCSFPCVHHTLSYTTSSAASSNCLVAVCVSPFDSSLPWNKMYMGRAGYYGSCLDNPIIQENEAGGLLWVLGQTRCQHETLSQNTK